MTQLVQNYTVARTNTNRQLMQCEKGEPLGRQIYLTAQEIKNYAEKILNPHGLTLEQFQLLKHMQPQTGMSQRQLGELADKSPANITRILDRLERKNLIVRRSSDTDRRASLVFLSGQGNALVKEVFSTFETFSTELTAGISPQEQEQTRKILTRIGRNIRAMQAKMNKQA